MQVHLPVPLHGMHTVLPAPSQTSHAVDPLPKLMLPDPPHAGHGSEPAPSQAVHADFPEPLHSEHFTSPSPPHLVHVTTVGPEYGASAVVALIVLLVVRLGVVAGFWRTVGGGSFCTVGATLLLESIPADGSAE